MCITNRHNVHKGSWHLHGHCHQNLQFDNGAMLDVGVDGFDFYPITFQQVRELLSNRRPKLWDHHTMT